MVYKERVHPIVYNPKVEEIARIRIKFEYHKGVLLWSTTQLEGFILGKWLPLIRYDFDPKDKIPVHINKEYLSTDDSKNKTQFKCHPDLLASTAWKLLNSTPDSQILDLIEKRKLVFLKEGK